MAKVGRLMPWIMAANAWSSPPVVQAAPPSGVWAWLATAQLKAKRCFVNENGCPGRLKLKASTSCPPSGSPLGGEKPKSPSRVTRAAPSFTSELAKASPAKSIPVGERSEERRVGNERG